MLIHELIVGSRQDHGDQSATYSVNFRTAPRQNWPYSRLMSTTESISHGKRAIGWCLVSATVAEIKLIYYASIKQQERSYFRQINFWCRDIIERRHHGSACLHTTSTCCQNQSTPLGTHANVLHQMDCKYMHIVSITRETNYLFKLF